MRAGLFLSKKIGAIPVLVIANTLAAGSVLIASFMESFPGTKFD